MTQPPPSTESLGFLLVDTTRAIRRRFEVRAAELGLSTSQWRLLINLEREGPMPQARLAQRLEIEPISVSRLVDRMQEAGWVERHPSPEDRRVKLVAPTDKAQSVVLCARDVARSIYAEALHGLPPDIEETLSAVLRHMIHNLSQAPEASDDHHSVQ